MAEYIEREKLLELYVDGKYDTTDYHVPVPVIIQNIKDIPAADVVPVGAYNQAAWERDTAIEQLKQIGKSFGEQMDDVRPVVLCKDCKYFSEVMYKGTQFEYGYCDRWADGTQMNHDDFCSRAAKREERWTQIVCKKCGGKRFITRGDVVVCDRCGADMREKS